MTKTILTLVTLASITATPLVGLGQETKTTVRPTKIEHAEPEEGWLVIPQDFHLGHAWGRVRERGAVVTGYSVVDAEGMLRVFLVQSGPDAVDTPLYRLVVFSRDGARHPLQRLHAGGMKNRDTEVKHAEFMLDPKVLAADKIAQIAIERVKPGKGREADPK